MITTTASGARLGPPFGLVLGVVAGWALLNLSGGALRDIDLYWHLLIGEQLQASPLSPPPPLGGWEILPLSPDWVSTQWLSEVLLWALHEAGGWAGLAGFRVFTAGVAVGILAVHTLKSRPLALAGWPFTITVLTLGVASQERSQQFTYIGAAVLSGVLIRGLEQATIPRWWIAVPGTILWANLHGGWVLVPAVFGLVGLGRVLDHGLRDPAAIRSFTLSAATIASGAVAPAGLANLGAVLRFSDAAAEYVVEWQPTEPFSRGGYVSLLMLGLVLVSWAQPRQVLRSEFLTTFILLLLAWTSWRNLAPALILLTPLVASQLTSAFPQVGRAEARWSAPLGVAAATTLTLIGLLSLPGRDHLPEEKFPISLATRLSDLPGETRVLNEYNVAGFAVYFGGPEVKVGIDGRTDYYGAQFIGEYLDLMHLRGDWEPLLQRLDPSAALIQEDLAITRLLQERGWDELGRENGYILLRHQD